MGGKRGECKSGEGGTREGGKVGRGGADGWGLPPSGAERAGLRVRTRVRKGDGKQREMQDEQGGRRRREGRDHWIWANVLFEGGGGWTERKKEPVRVPGACVVGGGRLPHRREELVPEDPLELRVQRYK